MSANTLSLLKAYDCLEMEEKHEFAHAILQRLPPIDSGPLDDDIVSAAGDMIAGLLREEEYATGTR